MAVARHPRRPFRLVAAVVLGLISIDGCERSDPVGPNALPPDLLDQAQADLSAGRYEEACTLLGQVVQAHPGDFAIRRKLAYAQAALGQFDAVDKTLRETPLQEQSDEPNVSGATERPVDQRTVMLWRRAYNVYRYHYHGMEADPSGVFRVGAIHDALEASDPVGQSATRLEQPVTLTTRQAYQWLRLWAWWEGMARDIDLYPNRTWIPVFVVDERESLTKHGNVLSTLEKAALSLWIHPDDQGRWLAHPGSVPVDPIESTSLESPKSVPNGATRTVAPDADLVRGWGILVGWLVETLPEARVRFTAATRAERDGPMNRRATLVGRLADGKLRIDSLVVDGPAEAMQEGHREFLRLRRADHARISSSVEAEALAHAYSAAGLSATAFVVDQRGRVHADDPLQLACALSYIRHGAALFGEPVVMTTAP